MKKPGARVEIYSFIYLSVYYVVICKECKYRVLAEGVYTHLVSKKHKDVLKEERRRITDQIYNILGIIKTEEQLKEF